MRLQEGVQQLGALLLRTSGSRTPSWGRGSQRASWDFLASCRKTFNQCKSLQSLHSSPFAELSLCVSCCEGLPEFQLSRSPVSQQPEQERRSGQVVADVSLDSAKVWHFSPAPGPGALRAPPAVPGRTSWAGFRRCSPRVPEGSWAVPPWTGKTRPRGSRRSAGGQPGLEERVSHSS